MATVYKIEIEATSPWINYHESYLIRQITNLLEAGHLKLKVSQIKITEK